MKIIPLAFDSLGTRSMSTFVETNDVKVLIDPGVALGPRRYNLAPHQIELERLKEHWAKIVKYATLSNVIIITHYHYDHHNPNDHLEIYKNKTVLIKHPTEKINRSQKERAAYFLQQIKELPQKLEYADGKEFQFGNTKIIFSQPVFHGTNSKLGYVTEVLIDDGYRFIHTSDVEGPSLDDQVDFILQNKPNLVILDGPLSYMLGFRYSHESLNASIKNMIKIIENLSASRRISLVIDHHFLRDLEWKDRIAEVFEAAKLKNVKVQTAAEFIGIPNDMLEARRRELWQIHLK